MISFLLAGLVSLFFLRREFFPETGPDTATVSLVYPGATPLELEESMAIKIEDALADLEDVKEIRTSLNEGGGSITVEFHESVQDIDKAVDDVEREIDRLQDLPQEAEKITVQLFEPMLPVIRLSVLGNAEESILKNTIYGIREELKTLPGMGQMVYSGVRNYELRVNVHRTSLLEHGLSLPIIADSIRQWMAEVPGGMVRSNTGNVKVRTTGVVERAAAIRQIVIRSTPQGQSLRVGDIATVHESFVDVDLITRFNGQPSMGLTVFKRGKQDIVKMAEMVRAYVDARQNRPLHLQGIERFYHSHRAKAYELGRDSPLPLPPGVTIQTNSDLARFVEGRLDLLTRNALQGGILVFATLFLFLNWRAAFWVFIGLSTALAGTLVIMMVLGITMNLLTMFGLIVVMGLLVDDGIVVSENIQKRFERGEPALVAAQKGAEQVFWPVVATVLTTIVTFLPLRFIQGRMGDLMGALPVVVACALFMSLVESLLILPCHMGHSLEAHSKDKLTRVGQTLRRYEQWRDYWIFDRIVPAYSVVVRRCITHRYLTLACALAVLTVSIGMVQGGRVKYIYLPNSDSETIVINAKMPIGTSIQKTAHIADLIAKAARAQPQVNNVDSVVGERANLNTGQVTGAASHITQIFIELKPVEERAIESSKITQNIRDALENKLPDIDSISYTAITGGPGGADITVSVRGNNMHRMNQLVEEIKTGFGEFQAVYDISDNNDLGQRELQLALKPSAAALGFTTASVAQQVRGMLYGIDTHVFTERTEDINVRVRLDAKTRNDLQEIQQLWILSPQGKSVPLSQIADITDGLTYSTIHRTARKRSISITADMAPNTSPESIVSEFKKKNLDLLTAKYSDLEIVFGGRQDREKRAFQSLPYGMMVAFVLVYVILAWLFGSYTQPIAVMLAIPFSLVGLIWGHWVLNYEITFLSIIGFVALSGIVVNDSLILIEFFNKHRSQGHSTEDSLVEAGKRRLRPIVLTTLTTVLGLLPLMLERSFQAKFMIPMAISISGGLLSATFLILLVLPCVILIIEDIKAGFTYCWHGKTRAEREAMH